MGIGFRQSYKATHGQTIFKTPKPYIVDSNELYVYLNGMTVGLGEHLDYIESDEYHITFNYGLEEGDVVTLATSFINLDIDIDVVGYKKALFTMYGSNNRLKNNQKYSSELRVKGKKVKWSFTSKYSPLYSTVEIIRSDTGEMLDNIPDDKINFVIYGNSKLLNNLLEEKAGESSSEDISINYKEKQWVRYKTCMDLINAVYLTASGNVGSINKKIGPILIEKTVKLPFISEMLKYFKGEFEKYDIATQEPVIAKTFVKAKETSYPIAARRSF